MDERDVNPLVGLNRSYRSPYADRPTVDAGSSPQPGMDLVEADGQASQADHKRGLEPRI